MLVHSMLVRNLMDLIHRAPPRLIRASMRNRNVKGVRSNLVDHPSLILTPSTETTLIVPHLGRVYLVLPMKDSILPNPTLPARTHSDLTCPFRWMRT
jgi:hypothetical protein